MENLPDSDIQELVQRKLDGESYSQIRTDLAERGLKDEEIKDVIREVDEQVLQAETGQRAQDHARRWYLTGLVIAIAGLILSIAFNGGYILTHLPPWLVYCPFLAGIVIMFYGRMLQRRKPSSTKKGSDRIRSKRPYK
jgi:hypothetical protein